MPTVCQKWFTIPTVPPDRTVNGSGRATSVSCVRERFLCGCCDTCYHPLVSLPASVSDARSPREYVAVVQARPLRPICPSSESILDLLQICHGWIATFGPHVGSIRAVTTMLREMRYRGLPLRCMLVSGAGRRLLNSIPSPMLNETVSRTSSKDRSSPP